MDGDHGMNRDLAIWLIILAATVGFTLGALGERHNWVGVLDGVPVLKRLAGSSSEAQFEELMEDFEAWQECAATLGPLSSEKKGWLPPHQASRLRIGR